jgi:hypothetical protein
VSHDPGETFVLYVHPALGDPYPAEDPSDGRETPDGGGTGPSRCGTATPGGEAEGRCV